MKKKIFPLSLVPWHKRWPSYNCFLSSLSCPLHPSCRLITALFHLKAYCRCLTATSQVYTTFYTNLPTQVITLPDRTRKQDGTLNVYISTLNILTLTSQIHWMYWICIICTFPVTESFLCSQPRPPETKSFYCQDYRAVKFISLMLGLISRKSNSINVQIQ